MKFLKKFENVQIILFFFCLMKVLYSAEDLRTDRIGMGLLPVPRARRTSIAAAVFVGCSP